MEVWDASIAQLLGYNGPLVAEHCSVDYRAVGAVSMK